MDGVGLLLAADRGAADGDGASGLLQSPEGGEVDGRVQSGGGGDSRMGDNRRKKEMGLSEGGTIFFFFFFFSFFGFFILFLSFFLTKEEYLGFCGARFL